MRKKIINILSNVDFLRICYILAGRPRGLWLRQAPSLVLKIILKGGK